MTTDIVSAFVSLALFTQQSVHWHEFRVLGTESGRSRSLGGGRLSAADSGQCLSFQWPKRTSSQHLCQHSNHRLAAAITDIVANQSTQTHKQASVHVHTNQCPHKYCSTEIK